MKMRKSLKKMAVVVFALGLTAYGINPVAFGGSRVLSDRECAAIAGGDKGQICAQPQSGDCKGTDDGGCSGSICPSTAQVGDPCEPEITLNEYGNPDRCSTTEDDTICCTDSDYSNGEKDCKKVYKCKCKAITGQLGTFCSTKSLDEHLKVAKCAHGTCPEEQ